MDKDKEYPTAQMRYLASLQNAGSIEDAIDVEKQFINYLENRDVPDLIVVDDAGFEVKRFEFGVDDMRSLTAAKDNLKRHEERLSAVNEVIAEILAENPELVCEPEEPVDYFPPGKTFDIWAEGYAATGEYGDATYLGTFNAESFSEAVEQYIALHPKEAHLFSKDTKGWTYWACRLFDNEAQARVSYG